MKSLMKRMHRGEKGLTLIELLIVVAILGIIAAVVIPNLGAFMVTGRISAANTEVENVKTASLAYYAEQELWPETSDVLNTYMAGNLTGRYTFDTAWGWITGGENWQAYGLAWIPGVDGENGSHGSWGRP